eukprot:15266418-Alexandrium_andersonii.AAC.1
MIAPARSLPCLLPLSLSAEASRPALAPKALWKRQSGMPFDAGLPLSMLSLTQLALGLLSRLLPLRVRLGSRAARLLEQVEYVGCPCRAGEPGRARPARILAGLTFVEPAEGWRALPPHAGRPSAAGWHRCQVPGARACRWDAAGAVDVVQERIAAAATFLRPTFSRIQPGRGRGQTGAGAQTLVECTAQIAGGAAAEALRLLSGELATIAARATE